MKEHIVGMMWNKNEGDILEEIILSALDHVDSLVIADDGSTDNSWDIIQIMSVQHPEIEHIQQNPNKADPAQRQQLLNLIRERYKPEDTWVQVIESDIMILEPDIREALERRSNGVFMDWKLLNGVLDPARDWKEWDMYPNWDRPIQEILTHQHKLEVMTYTYRPFKELVYRADPWRPWPSGFGCVPRSNKKRVGDAPLLAHYGYRGPTHMQQKYLPSGRFHKKYKDWDFKSIDSTLSTVPYFNGAYNSRARPMIRRR
jgi:glycosyltransferase involved in cell wall biosynthesis